MGFISHSVHVALAAYDVVVGHAWQMAVGSQQVVIIDWDECACSPDECNPCALDMGGCTDVHEGWAALPLEVRQRKGVCECNPATLARVCRRVSCKGKYGVILLLHGG